MEKIKKLESLESKLQELITLVYTDLNVDFNSEPLKSDSRDIRLKLAELKDEVSQLIVEVDKLPFVPD